MKRHITSKKLDILVSSLFSTLICNLSDCWHSEIMLKLNGLVVQGMTPTTTPAKANPIPTWTENY